MWAGEDQAGNYIGMELLSTVTAHEDGYARIATASSKKDVYTNHKPRSDDTDDEEDA